MSSSKPRQIIFRLLKQTRDKLRLDVARVYSHGRRRLNTCSFESHGVRGFNETNEGLEGKVGGDCRVVPSRSVICHAVGDLAMLQRHEQGIGTYTAIIITPLVPSRGQMERRFE
jgi:hypothetical protein